MIGNETKRFCGDCKLNVYNLSGMTKTEAENLLMYSEGRLCARFFRRADGTILTKDCPVGWAAAKQKISRVWTAVASMALTMISGIGIVSFVRSGQEASPIMGAIPVERYEETGSVISEPVPELGEPVMEMGDIAYPDENVTMGKIRIEK
jgi:hypothetical protein